MQFQFLDQFLALRSLGAVCGLKAFDRRDRGENPQSPQRSATEILMEEFIFLDGFFAASAIPRRSLRFKAFDRRVHGENPRSSQRRTGKIYTAARDAECSCK